MLINFSVLADDDESYITSNKSIANNRIPVIIHLDIKPKSDNGYELTSSITPELTITPGEKALDTGDRHANVTSVVTAHLDAPDFVVTPTPAEEQSIEDQATWNWILVPQKSGSNLPVKVSIMLHTKVGEHEEIHALPPINTNIKVNQTAWQKFLEIMSHNWLNILGNSAVLTFLGWLGKKFFDRFHK
jgi:hypothetical protein